MDLRMRQGAMRGAVVRGDKDVDIVAATSPEVVVAAAPLYGEDTCVHSTTRGRFLCEASLILAPNK